MRNDRRVITRLLEAVDPPSAERSWRIALSAMLAARHLQPPVDIGRVLEMAVVQAVPGTPDEIRDMLDQDLGLHVYALLLELDTAGTSEARLVHALGAMIDGRPVGGHDRIGRAVRDAALQ